MQNLFIIEGTVVEAEFQSFPSGSDLIKVRIAVSTQTRDGERVNQPQIHIWNRGEQFAKQFQAGVVVNATGMLQTRTWEYEGQERTSTELVASRASVIGSAPAPAPAAKAAKAVKIAG